MVISRRQSDDVPGFQIPGTFRVTDDVQLLQPEYPGVVKLPGDGILRAHLIRKSALQVAVRGDDYSIVFGEERLREERLQPCRTPRRLLSILALTSLSGEVILKLLPRFDIIPAASAFAAEEPADERSGIQDVAARPFVLVPVSCKLKGAFKSAPSVSDFIRYMKRPLHSGRRLRFG